MHAQLEGDQVSYKTGALLADANGDGAAKDTLPLRVAPNDPAAGRAPQMNSAPGQAANPDYGYPSVHNHQTPVCPTQFFTNSHDQFTALIDRPMPGMAPKTPRVGWADLRAPKHAVRVQQDRMTGAAISPLFRQPGLAVELKELYVLPNLACARGSDVGNLEGICCRPQGT